jgi:hypothetical protein
MSGGRCYWRAVVGNRSGGERLANAGLEGRGEALASVRLEDRRGRARADGSESTEKTRLRRETYEDEQIDLSSR